MIDIISKTSMSYGGEIIPDKALISHYRKNVRKQIADKTAGHKHDFLSIRVTVNNPRDSYTDRDIDGLFKFWQFFFSENFPKERFWLNELVVKHTTDPWSEYVVEVIRNNKYTEKDEYSIVRLRKEVGCCVATLYRIIKRLGYDKLYKYNGQSKLLIPKHQVQHIKKIYEATKQIPSHFRDNKSPEDVTKNMLTLQQASERLNVSQSLIHKNIINRKIRAKKVDNKWFVTSKEIDKFGKEYFQKQGAKRAKRASIPTHKRVG